MAWEWVTPVVTGASGAKGMSEPVMVARGVVPASYHAFYLIDLPPHGSPPWPAYGRFPNGLIQTQPDGIAVITTGVADGDVDVQVELHQQAPPLDIDEWDEAIEVSLEAPHGHLGLGALDADLTQPMPELTPQGPGTYRIRLHARGRDTAIDLSPLTVVEHYLLQIWPAPPAAETIHKQTDTYGASKRRSTHNTP